MDRFEVIEQRLGESVTELIVRVRRADHLIPAAVWLPAGQEQPPVVLMGHGGSEHKRSDRHRRLATWLAAEAGIASLAIDGPFHGDRAAPGDSPNGYQQRIRVEGPARVHDRMLQDWLCSLDAVADEGLVGGDLVGLFGMSMGARYGLPVAAALGERLRCAVIGKFGLTSTAALTHLAANDRIRESAHAINAPVLMHVQWDDEVFPRDGQFELFDQLASPQKRLQARPGRHRVTRPDDEATWRAYLASHLAQACKG